MELNVGYALRNERKQQIRFQSMAFTWTLLLQWCSKKWGLVETQVKRRMYYAGQELWLALYLAQRSTSLYYKAVWSKAILIQYIFLVWHACANLAPAQ
jgi:hypothetical protein